VEYLDVEESEVCAWDSDVNNETGLRREMKSVWLCERSYGHFREMSRALGESPNRHGFKRSRK